jgi:hypothetical protein
MHSQMQQVFVSSNTNILVNNEVFFKAELELSTSNLLRKEVS